MYILNSVSSKKELQSVFWDDVFFSKSIHIKYFLKIKKIVICYLNFM